MADITFGESVSLCRAGGVTTLTINLHSRYECYTTSERMY